MSEWKMPEIPEGFPQAVFDKVIVDVSHAIYDKTKKEEVLDSGIIVPIGEGSEGAMKLAQAAIPLTGIVVSVGDNCKVVRKGMRVALPLNEGAMKYFNYDEKPEDTKYVIMDEKDVPAIF